MLKTSNNIFAYIRHYEGKKMLVMCSFTDKELAFRVEKNCFDIDSAELMLSNYDKNVVIHNGFMTRPYETRVYLEK